MVGVNGLQRPRRVPPYYVFCPTDEQLIVYYLGNYVAGRPLPYDGVIGSADVYATEPYNLLPSPLKCGDEAYFFSPRTRGRRTAGGGTWRLERKVDIFDEAGDVVGYKGTLSFHYSSHNTRKATGWVMHEYVLGGQDDDRTNFKPVALYRIHRKASKEDKDQEDQESPDREDQESPVPTPDQEDQEPEQRQGTIGSLMQLPAPEPTVTIEYQNNSCYDVEVAPPIDDDQNDGGFSSEPTVTAGYCGGFFESHATVQPTNTVGSSVASQAPLTIEDQSNRCYDVTVAPPTDDENHAGFSSEPATEEYNGGFFESYFATVQPTSMIGSSTASSALITGDSDGLFESYAAVQPTIDGTSMASLASPEAAASLENGISDDDNGLLSEIGKNPQEVADVSEIPNASVASDGADAHGVFFEQCDDLVVTIEELMGSSDEELDTWPDISSMVGWAF